MKRAATWIKKYWKNFDDSLINPPPERNDKKDFKGQTIHRRTLADGGPKPTPEQVYMRTKIMDDEEPRLQPRAQRFKHFRFGMAFLIWYVGVTLFIMYRMKGDDLDLLEKEAKKREIRKKDLGLD